MMLLAFCLVSSATMVLNSTVNTAQSTWPEALCAKAKKANQTRSEAVPNQVSDQQGRGSDIYALILRSADPKELTQAQEEMLRQYHAGFARDIKRAEALIDQGGSAEGRLLLEGRLAAFPWEGLTAIRLADAHFQLEQNQAAYNLLAPRATSYAAEGLLLRASLAAARRGEVYPGQRQYCLDRILPQDWAEMKGALLESSVPSENTPRSVELLSSLAIALSESSVREPHVLYHLANVLRIDPTNPLASWRIGDIHLRNRRYADAARSYERAQSRARGPMVTIVKRQLEIAKYLRDN